MDEPHSSPKGSNNLRTRVLVAFTMIPVALLFVWLGGWWMAAMCGAGALVLGYEWSKMARLPRGWIVPLASTLPVITYMVKGLELSLVVLCVAALAAALLQPIGHREKVQTVLGTIYTAGLPLGFLVLREGDWNGQAAALMMMGMVWASDSSAYFVGRTLGGPLLSPKDSPNKTWSGAIGAVVFTGLTGLIAAYLVSAPPLRWVAFAALLSVICQYGDMIESRVKRAFGAKDASSLLPGHGGLMDRVDGLGAVCVVGAVVFMAFPALLQYLGLVA